MSRESNAALSDGVDDGDESDVEDGAGAGAGLEGAEGSDDAGAGADAGAEQSALAVRVPTPRSSHARRSESAMRPAGHVTRPFPAIFARSRRASRRGPMIRPSLLLLLAPCVGALQLRVAPVWRHSPAAPRLIYAQFPSNPFEKKPPPPPDDDDEENYISPERKAFEEGKGNLFFQSPTPKTGDQQLPDFFSKESLSNSDAGDLATFKVLGGISVVLLLFLLVSLITS